MKCKKCNEDNCVKKGKRNGRQRYHCISCGAYFQKTYIYSAYDRQMNGRIQALLKEGVGILGTSRLLNISKNTVMSRIIKIADCIKPPPIRIGKECQLDEMSTYIGNKNRRRWIAYSIDQNTRKVVNFIVGPRTKRTLLPVVNSLLLADPKKIHTDKLNIYKSLIPRELHGAKQYAINHIERMNLSLRTHLKRLNRKTICYSKSLTMLVACLKIYFWDACERAL